MKRAWYKTKRGVVAAILFWPITILYIFAVQLKKLTDSKYLSNNNLKDKQHTDNGTVFSVVKRDSEGGITGSLRIPEPTRSLLWTTDEDTSKIEHAGSINLVISITENDVRVDEKENGFFSEPSLIWTKLPVTPNNELVKEAMYWPEYSRFYPKTRYQYLNWLTDITTPTNLSYVFLYFYGLERHLLIGDYDGAVDEILRLVKHHDKPSFVQYAARSLTVASIAKGRMDIIERAPFLLEEEIDETLSLRIHKGTTMTPDDIIGIASRVGFTNKRYIKLYPARFKKELQLLINQFESKHGKLLSVFHLENFHQEETSVFANNSIPEKARNVKVPVILEDSRFQTGIRTLLETAHNNLKQKLTKERNH